MKGKQTAVVFLKKIFPSTFIPPGIRSRGADNDKLCDNIWSERKIPVRTANSYVSFYFDAG